MVQGHLARLTAPKHWVLARKDYHWTARPSAGPHGLKECVSVNLLLKELLGVARTTKEASAILNNNHLAIDGKIRKSYKFPVGLMDVVEIEKINKSYRVLLNEKGRFFLMPIGKDEANLKLLEIKNKRMIKKAKMQITFHDGRTMIADKFDGNVGDSVLFDLKNKKILELLRLEEGALIYLTSGKHVGKIRKVRGILKGQDLQRARVVFEENNNEISTLIDYAFVVGKENPVLKLEIEQRGKARNE